MQRSYYSSGDRPDEDKTDEDSVANNSNKTSALNMTYALDDDNLKSQALAVSPVENVLDWVAALASAQTRSPQRLADIQRHLKIPLIEV